MPFLADNLLLEFPIFIGHLPLIMIIIYFSLKRKVGPGKAPISFLALPPPRFERRRPAIEKLLDNDLVKPLGAPLIMVNLNSIYIHLTLEFKVIKLKC